jgi:hypothetical protein
MSKQVGLDMDLYYNSATWAAPTWALISDCRDLTGPDSFAEADVSRRAAGFKQTEPSLRDASFEWEMVYDPLDAAFALLKARYAAKTLIELALADGPILTVGTIYFRIECKLFKFERNESLEGANLYSVSAKPCYSANPPQVVTV